MPTLYVGDYYLNEQPGSEAQAKMNELTRKYRAQHIAAVGKAIKAGVHVGVGTDYVGFPVKQGVRELGLLVEAGMTPMQAIQAATRVNSELLGWQDRVGTVEPGKLADIIAVPGDPLRDLSRAREGVVRDARRPGRLAALVLVNCCRPVRSPRPARQGPSDFCE